MLTNNLHVLFRKIPVGHHCLNAVCVFTVPWFLGVIFCISPVPSIQVSQNDLPM